jgi:hypothetical protein
VSNISELLNQENTNFKLINSKYLSDLILPFPTVSKYSSSFGKSWNKNSAQKTIFFILPKTVNQNTGEMRSVPWIRFSGKRKYHQFGRKKFEFPTCSSKIKLLFLLARLTSSERFHPGTSKYLS